MQRPDLVAIIIGDALRRVRGTVGTMQGNTAIADALSGERFTGTFHRVIPIVLKEIGFTKEAIEQYKREFTTQRTVKSE